MNCKKIERVYSSKKGLIEPINISIGPETFESGTFAITPKRSKNTVHDRKIKPQGDFGIAWGIKVASPKPLLILKEVVTLPGPHPTWETGGDLKMLEGGRVAVTEKEFPIYRELVVNSWGLTPEDPKGEYKIDIFYQNKLIYSVKFEVQ